MKTPWGRESPSSMRQQVTDNGIAFSLSDKSSANWWNDHLLQPATLRPAAAYLGQLLNEGIATTIGGAVVITWDEVYELQSDANHAGSLSLLTLPATSDWSPCLESRGTPSDADFAIAVVGWNSTQSGRRTMARIGAVVEAGEERWLLTEAAWRTCVLIKAFAMRSRSMSSEERMHALGEIRAFAVEAGASLDDYLRRTNIVSPRKLRIELRREDVLQVPVVEVRPHPVGAPEGFVEAFDRYRTVRSRYDIPQPDGGLVHVSPEPSVVAALNAIKAMPGRRLSSEQARLFGHNPFGVLGEEAQEALDEDDLIRARQEAGLLPYRLSFLQGSGGAPSSIQLVPLLECAESRSVEVTPELARVLLEQSGRSRSRRLPLFHWEGYEIELNPITEQALTGLATWLACSSIAGGGLTYSEVMNLEAYSDRVVGFDARVQTVPYVAKRDSSAGWIPENVEAGIALVERNTGDIQKIAMSPDAIAELRDKIAAAIAGGVPEVTLPGSTVNIPVQRAQELVTVLQDAEISIGKKKAPVSQSSDPKNESKRAILQILHNIESLDYVKTAVASSHASPETEMRLPRALREEVRLLPHQEEGLAWLQYRYELQSKGMSGCLLADDMGLGKTLQSLCLIAWHDEQSDAPKPCLVVAPVSLLENWKLEIEKFLGWPTGAVLSLYGANLSGLRLGPAALDADLTNAGIQKLLRPGFEAGYKIVLTTYETLRDYEFSLARVGWGVVVCDEAQKIKNPAAFVTQAAKALRADFRIACTGTPVENTLADLWCLFDYFQPGYLGSLNEFTRQYRRDIEARTEGHAALVERLRGATKPWVLRRMKTEVHQGLPAKLEGEQADASCLALPMSPSQSRMYADAVANYRAVRDSEDGGMGTQILALLAKLRMICAHPLSVVCTDHETRPLSEHLAASPKLSWLMMRLDAIRRRDEKVIVFTEFRDLQRLIQRAVAERFGYAAQIINGSTAVDAQSEHSRQKLIDRFQAEKRFGVIILSTTAVGFGVNIQAANHVVHFTRPWNPAKEDQATDRAYRIGQSKDVFVYCPTLVGNGFESFEERLAKLLEGKRDLSRDMLSGVQEVTAEDFVDL